MRVILLMGEARSGKDTVADYIMSQLAERGKTALPFAFADPIKEALSVITGLSIRTLDYMKNNNIPYNGVSVRKMMQDLGTSQRQLNENIYTDIVIKRIEHVQSSIDYAIITDGRFVSEHYGIKQKFPNARSVRVLRENIQIGLDKTEKQHVSESQLSLIPLSIFDHVIHNDGDLSDLHTNIEKMIIEGSI